MRKILLLLSLFFVGLFTGCATKEVIKQVYIPTKCDIPERVKPKRENYTDSTQFQAHLRAYYKNIESDLLFCRVGKVDERIKPPP